MYLIFIKIKNDEDAVVVIFKFMDIFDMAPWEAGVKSCMLIAEALNEKALNTIFVLIVVYPEICYQSSNPYA